MTSLVDGLLLFPTGAGICLCALGYTVYRRAETLGRTALVAFLIVFGLGTVLGSIGGLLGGSPDGTSQPMWVSVTFVAWSVAAVPWLSFAVQYTGQYTEVDRRTVAVLYAPFVLLMIGIPTQSRVGSVLTSTVFIYALSLFFFGAALLIRAARSYVHLATRYGVALSVLPITVMLSLNFSSILRDISAGLQVVSYVGSLGVGVALFGWVLLSTPFLERTPAVQAVGRRSFADKTDDLLFIVDEDGTVVEYNTTAAETLRSSPQAGEMISSALGFDTDTLGARETVTVETETATQRYDPQVSSITDGDGTYLGAVCSLRDVTDRELREQRLAVLARVLRHNLRNQVDVIKSHAEAVGGDHGTAIVDAADDITELGYRARRIDQFVSESAAVEPVDVAALLESVLDSVDADDSSVTVAVDCPGRVTVHTSRPALEAALESAVDNAVRYADSTVELSVTPADGECTVVVSDDGPGIPENELDAIAAGTETALQHGTGLGLWQLAWAVRTVGGDLSFDTTDGTTVSFTVRDRREDGGRAGETQ